MGGTWHDMKGEKGVCRRMVGMLYLYIHVHMSIYLCTVNTWHSVSRVCVTARGYSNHLNGMAYKRENHIGIYALTAIAAGYGEVRVGARALGVLRACAVDAISFVHISS